MIEAGTAQELIAQIRDVEGRLERLLVSGWRQASAEAADLQQAADTFREIGLVELAARIEAVAGATDAASALPAVALAASACQLLRLRLSAPLAPKGWSEVGPPGRQTPTNDTLVPLCRFTLDGQEAWACAWPARSQIVTLSPPPLAVPEIPRPESGGFLGRLKQSARHMAGLAQTDGSIWLHRRLRGSITWAGRQPVGVAGDVPLCTLDKAHWVDEDEFEHGDQYRDLIAGLTKAQDTYSGMIGWSGVILTIGELELARTSEYDWIDPSMAAAFAALGQRRAWALFALMHPLTVPLAVLEPGRTPRIVHLTPGQPSDPLTTSV